MNDLDIDLDRNTPWVDMSACVKFGLDQPIRLAGHTEHRYTGGGEEGCPPSWGVDPPVTAFAAVWQLRCS